MKQRLTGQGQRITTAPDPTLKRLMGVETMPKYPSTKSLANRHKSIWPAPVYEAHFRNPAGGPILVHRMSCDQPVKMKGWNFDLGRRLLADVFGRMIDPDMILIDGFMEHDAMGKPWFRQRDPAFLPATVETIKPKRVTAKQVLRDLLAAMDDPQSDFPAALEVARKLAA